MIDNFLGIGTGHFGFCHRMRHAVMILFFFFLKDRSSLQYFITQGIGQSSMFLTFHTICNFRGRTSALGRVGGGNGGIPGMIPVSLIIYLESFFLETVTPVSLVLH